MQESEGLGGRIQWEKAKPSDTCRLLILVGNFEETEVTGERFVAIFDQESACG